MFPDATEYQVDGTTLPVRFCVCVTAPNVVCVIDPVNVPTVVGDILT